MITYYLDKSSHFRAKSSHGLARLRSWLIKRLAGTDLIIVGDVYTNPHQDDLIRVTKGRGALIIGNMHCYEGCSACIVPPGSLDEGQK